MRALDPDPWAFLRRRRPPLKDPKVLKLELGKILARLSECCLAEPKFVWPEYNDLDQLDDIVRESRTLIRGGVHGRVLGIATKQSINSGRNCDSVRDFATSLTEPDRNAPHRSFEILMRLGSGARENQKLAESFFATILKIRKGDSDPVEWERFAPILLAVRNEQCSGTRKPAVVLATKGGHSPGPPRLVAYAVYLKMENEDCEWKRIHWEGFTALIAWAYGTRNIPLFQH
ncbi:MAG: hypothetical protein QOD99_423 [Chthoniobacter sp.]|nr:hypothetical protein [Chthoniobacter sp.]